MSVKPITSLILLLLVGFFLLMVELVFPTSIFLSNGSEIKFISINELFNPKKIEYADIKSIEERIAQSAQKTENASSSDVIAQFDSLAIQYPEGNDTVLNSFFKSINEISINQNLVRVLHFGDSQVEGDRITGDLRNRFQAKFGGCGTGLLHVVDKLNARHSHTFRDGGVWNKYASYGPRNGKCVASNFGLLGSYFKSDSGYSTSEINIKKTYLARANESKAEVFTFLGSNIGDTSEVSIIQEDKPLIQYYNTPERTSYLLNKNTSDKVKIKLKNIENKVLQAVSFDCKSGITFDNVSMRGSSGTEFVKMNPTLLRAQLQALNTQLIILQFGVNVVPYVLNDYTYYENLFTSQLKFLKKVAPHIPILVIGVSDMSRKEGDNYVSYPNVELVRNAQRRAAFKTGCAFWDLYLNMGGKNSMPSWVNAEKPLANPDYTHFTNTGASYVGEMLYNALNAAYDKYKK